MDVTSKSFAFCTKNSIPLYYVSACDGTNVVKVPTNLIIKKSTHIHLRNSIPFECSFSKMQ